jgi:hypothetical protein
MKRKEFFSVIYDTTDISLLVKDYNTNEALIDLGAGQSLYVGYYKKFGNFFMQFSELNVEAVELLFEYFDGTIWKPLAVIDETFDFTKSGFIYFDRPVDWKETSVEAEEGFFIRITPDTNLSVTTKLSGLNVLFSNDEDLQGIRSNIVDRLNNGQSWVHKHEASRRYIVQHLRNMGNRKISVLDPQNNPLVLEKQDVEYYSNLNQFDLFDPFELREASKFYTLSFIYLDELSDEEGDKWERQGLRYQNMADESINLFMLRFDKDDSGVEELNENEGETRTDLSWV